MSQIEEQVQQIRNYNSSIQYHQTRSLEFMRLFNGSVRGIAVSYVDERGFTCHVIMHDNPALKGFKEMMQLNCEWHASTSLKLETELQQFVADHPDAALQHWEEALKPVQDGQ